MQHSTSRPSLPGTFSYAQQDTGSLPRVSGAKSHIFQPPRTPSASAASSLYLSQSQIPYANNPNNAPIGASRKRSRTDYDPRDESMERITVGRTSSGRWTAAELAGDQATDLSRSVEMTDPGSPIPFVNTQYMLAGGMDTPSQALENAAARSDYYLGDPVDMGYRRERTGASRQNTFQDDPDYFHTTDVNGRPRNMMQYEENRGEEGWNITKLAVGVVGKVWEFCKLSGAAFRGFHAGGGKGYDKDLQPDDSEIFWLEKNESVDKEGTPIPGSWTAVGEEDLDIIPDYMNRDATDDLNRTPERGIKRRQISTPKEEIAKNWVVVPQNNTPSKPSQTKPLGRFSMPTNASSSRRGIFRPSTATTATSFIPRPPLRRPIVSRSSVAATSHAGSPSLHSQKPASFASPRSPGGSKIPVSQSREGSPRKSHHSKMNNSIGGVEKPESPAAKEAKKWAAMKRKEEREADESIRRLDAQLKAMIKEGKEALGTKVTVEMEDDEVPSSSERGGGSRIGHWSRASVAGVGTGASARKWDF